MSGVLDSTGHDGCFMSSSSGCHAEKATRIRKHVDKPNVCEALGCLVKLRDTRRAYCLKHGLCRVHLKAESLLRKGGDTQLWRFCQQCGKLETLDNFDGVQRSCRLSLSKRRRCVHTDVEDSMPTTDDISNTTSSNSCSSLSQLAPAPSVDPVPEQLTCLAGQLHTIQSMFVQLGHEADAAAAQVNASWRPADTHTLSANTLMPAAVCGHYRNLSATVAGFQGPNSFICSPGSFTSCPAASSAPAVIAPASIQEFMQLVVSDEAHFAAWLEQQLQQDFAAPAGQHLTHVSWLSCDHKNQVYTESVNPVHLSAAVQVPVSPDHTIIQRELWELWHNWWMESC